MIKRRCPAKNGWRDAGGRPLQPSSFQATPVKRVSGGALPTSAESKSGTTSFVRCVKVSRGQPERWTSTTIPAEHIPWQAPSRTSAASPRMAVNNRSALTTSPAPRASPHEPPCAKPHRQTLDGGRGDPAVAGAVHLEDWGQRAHREASGFLQREPVVGRRLPTRYAQSVLKGAKGVRGAGQTATQTGTD